MDVMTLLFSEKELSSYERLYEFERGVSGGRIDWNSFYELNEKAKDGALRFLLEQKLISQTRGGNFPVFLADSCRPELALKLDGKEVYFTRREHAIGFSDYLHMQGCTNLTRR